MKTPAIESLAAQINPDFTLAQIVISKSEGGYQILHLADREHAIDTLEIIPLSNVRDISQFTADGVFRPLKSAPNLRSGWILRVRNEEDLEYALNQIYPGAVADWHAHGKQPGQPTNYREFTNRQTGMYRITQFLTDEQAAHVITACCDARFCLKCRLWSVDSLPPDSSREPKSVIPCFEPCAVFLEFARTASRMEQEEKLQIPLSQSEIETVRAALETQLSRPDLDSRGGDIRRPDNPRRLLLLLQRWPGKSSSPIE